MMQRTSLLCAVVIGSLASFMAVGCGNAHKYTRVELRGLLDHGFSGPEYPYFLDRDERVTIDSPRIVQELSGFFPGLGTGRWAYWQCRCSGTLEFAFSDEDGNRVTVYAKGHGGYESWGSDLDQGDLSIKGDLATYLEALFAEITVRRAPRPPYEKVKWRQFEINIDGESRKMRLKKYPKPITVQKAMEGLELGPSDQARKSAFGTLAMSAHIGLRLKTKTDLQAYAQLFEFPEKVMARLEKLEATSSGWDDLAIQIRKSEKMHFLAKQLVGEVVFGDKHVFASQLPGSVMKFRVFRRMPDGRYCIVDPWDASLRLFLHGKRLLGLFEGVKTEPSRNSVIDGREEIIAEYISTLKVIPDDGVLPAGYAYSSAITVLGMYRAKEAVPQLLRLICVREHGHGARYFGPFSCCGLGMLAYPAYPAREALIRIGMPSVLAIRDIIERPKMVLDNKKTINHYAHVIVAILGRDHAKAWLLEEKRHCPKGAEANYDKLLSRI